MYKGNYEFVKTPNVKNVKAGQTVSYTFSGFGNKWGIPIKKYTITDRPDKGFAVGYQIGKEHREFFSGKPEAEPR